MRAWAATIEEIDQLTDNWQGTRIPSALAERLQAEPAPVSVHQTVRLRLLTAR